MDLALSVIVVSDYEEDAPRLWLTTPRILEALARQDFPEPYEVLLVENERYRDTAPPDLPAICPRLTILCSPETQSARLKDPAPAVAAILP
jgi:hypothetical protein